MRRIVGVVFWSALSAAFIGPGTVTTAAQAGSLFGLSLLWALVFSTIACWTLQEAAARLTIASGRTLGEALSWRFAGSLGHRALPMLAVGAVVFGCAAYQAGNILGAVAGVGLAVDLPVPATAVAVGLVAALGLWLGSPRGLALLLGAIVGVMGLAFLACAISARPSPAELVAGSLLPALPAGSSTLVLGLIGTTVVPYNLFLGSGLARGRDLVETRWCLSIAIPLGGLISMGVLVAGTAVRGPFGYDSLVQALEQVLGPWAGAVFAVGLFAAGLSSAITAPLAAGMAVASQIPASPARVGATRLTAMIVLGLGLAFGVAGVRPVPVIVLAQALNGLLLPFVAAFLLLAVNDRRLVGAAVNGALGNAVAGSAVFVSLVVGIRSLLRAGAAAGLPSPGEGAALPLALGLGLALVLPLAAAIRRQHRRGGDDRELSTPRRR